MRAEHLGRPLVEGTSVEPDFASNRLPHADQQARERARLSALDAALGAKADTVPVPANEPALLLDVDSGLIFPLDGAPDSR